MSFLWPNVLWLAIPVLALLWWRRRQQPPAIDFPSLALVEGGLEGATALYRLDGDAYVPA